MRCIACDKALTDYEATRRSAFTNEYTDLCNNCFASISEDLHTIERTDLAHDDDMITTDDDFVNHCGLDIDKDY
jgi:hypothetical protein